MFQEPTSSANIG